MARVVSRRPRTPLGAEGEGARATPLGVLWRLSRPHTVIGTSLSVLAIYAIAVTHARASPLSSLPDLAGTLLAAYMVNLFIVGINQVEDVEIDRVNKPFLPIASGDLRIERARLIVWLAALLALALALSQGMVETVAVTAALLVGWAYSCPPLHLKRYPALAAVSISAVRALVVNLGVWAHFAGSLGSDATLAPSVIALTLFVIPFALAIALLKDVPDIEGDRRHDVWTYSVRLGPRRVMTIGMAILAFAYAGMAIAGPLLITDADPWLIGIGHAAAFVALAASASRTRLDDVGSFTRFYMRVWKLFFLEYVLVAFAVVVAAA